MKQLRLGFKNKAGKTKSLALNYVNQDLDATTVKKVMADIVASKMFMQDGEELYSEPAYAKYVDSTEDVLF